MMRTFRSELMKLRRPRVLYGSLGGLFGFTILVTVLTFATAKDTVAPGGGPQQGATIAELTAAGGLTAGFTNAARLVGVVVLVVFLTGVTTEYGLGTLRAALLRQPRRDRFLAGKALALLACTASALLVALGASMAAATIVAGARGIPTDAWFTGGGLGAAAGVYADAVLAAACYGAIGLTLGVLLRSTPIAVGVGLFWFVMVENIASNTWAGAGHWLPGLLAGAVSAGGGDVPYSHGLAGVLVYGALAVTTGFLAFSRRDVSA